MNDVRLKFTNNEKFAQQAIENAEKSFAMNEGDIKDLIVKEKKIKFNEQVDEYTEELNKQKEQVEEYQNKISEKVETLEIKPLFNRIMVKPFAANPFQKLTIENGIITDIGGMNPNIEFNRDTGEYQERNQNIIVATVVEVGPECKYTQPGDTVFYLKGIPTPVPFFKQGFWTLKEENLIAVVNDNLTERFNSIKNGD